LDFIKVVLPAIEQL